MKKIFSLLIIVCFATNLFADDFDFDCALVARSIEENECDSPLIDLEGLPNSIVGGAVNVITGHYTESETDIFYPGPNPVVLQRSFNSGNTKGTLCKGWDLNQHGKIYYYSNDSEQIAIVHDRGAQLLFEGMTFKKLKLNKKLLRYGVTNCSSRTLSARNNIANRILKYDGKHCKLFTEGGEILDYKRKSGDSYKAKYYLNTVLHPNGCFKKNVYDGKLLTQVLFKGKTGNILGYLRFSYDKNQLTVRSSGDRRTIYLFDKKNKLKKVIREHALDLIYDYAYINKKTAERLIKKSWPDERYLQIQYYETGNNDIGEASVYVTKSDSKIGRVSALYAPMGTDTTPHLTYQFFYTLNKDKISKKPIGGHADVLDALGYKSTYHFSDEHRLTAIEHFSEDESLYRTETVFWGNNGTDEYTFLKARGLKNDSGEFIFCRSYTYDKIGNPIQEHLAGNLSGAGEMHPTINKRGHLISNGCEVYTKHFTYTPDNLVKTESDGRNTISYLYHSGTDLVKLKLVSDENEIKERYHFDYDKNSAVMVEITDNGKSKNIHDFTGVSERYIKRIQNTSSVPIGLPETIEEFYLDLSSNREVLLKSTVNTYSPQGYLTSQVIYDSQEILAFRQELVYDAMGNVIEETDPLGHKTWYQYDANGNCIFKQSPNLDYHNAYQYDFSNRLIREEEIYSDGKHLAQTYSYDLKGNKVSSTDIYGNTTRYIYDPFDRLIKKILPSVPDADGNLYHPVETYCYDIANNLTQKTDGNGAVTNLAYTAWGNPYLIQHPDGSCERSNYNLDGTLHKFTDRNGTETVYTYDNKKRKIKEEKFDQSCELLATYSWSYDTFHLIAETDPEGHTTNYQYDGAGRLICVKKGDTETRYVYDTLGRKKATWAHYADGQYKITQLEYDVLDRIVDERITDNDGKLYSRKSYGYDVDGNQTLVAIHTSTGISNTKTDYNSHQKTCRITAPDGQITIITYNYDYMDSWGQVVACEEEVDPKGNIKFCVKDTLDRLALEETKNPLSEVVKRTTYFYDAVNNVKRRFEDILVSDEVKKVVCTAFNYDLCNREIEIIEAFGEPEQKKTCREYTSMGQVARIIKPDGVVITHTYDPLDRLIEKSSSDGTVHYNYTYNLNDNVTCVHDHNRGTKTRRIFDQHNRIVEETLAHGATLKYAYDCLGRITNLTFPDSSSVAYSYDAKNLNDITRHRLNDSYIHRYHYDLSCRVSSTDLPKNLGNIHYRYDSCLRTTHITSPYWTQTLSYDTCGNPNRITSTDGQGNVETNYNYDALHQLIAEEGTTHHTYKFDSRHNRTTKDTTTYENNSLNQLKQQGNTNYRYDPNGNLIRKENNGEITDYKYDALDRLTAVMTQNQKVTYEYDSFHRRLQKHVEKDGFKISERYIYQGEKEIGTLNHKNKISELRILGIGKGDVGAMVAVEINNKLYIPINDNRGNITCLLNPDTKTVIETYRYTAYGEEEIYSLSEKPLSPWRFSSKRVDPETRWLFFGYRYYDPEVGHWTTPDPLWFEDGFNLYCYVLNRPIMCVDPDGLSARHLFSVYRKLHHHNKNEIFPFEEICSGVPGHYNTSSEVYNRSETFTVGNETYDYLTMTFINGMRNSLNQAKESAKLISIMAGGCKVHGVYNSTHGFWLDLEESAINLLGYKTEPVELLHKTWNEAFQNMPENGRIFHLCYSQGAIHTRNALESYDTGLRKRVDVYALAPAAYIDRDTCGHVVHYTSERDFVHKIEPFLNQFRMQKNNVDRDTIINLKPHPNAPRWDHDFKSDTYQEVLKDDINSYFINRGLW